SIIRTPSLTKKAPSTAPCWMPASKSPTMAWSSNFRIMTAPTANSIEKPLLSEAEFTDGFHAIGEARYHHKHPFHLLMHEGKLTRGQLQAWALNRYAYQSSLPRKDAAILARCNDPDFRRAWRKRILDHDGEATKPGGIEKWLRLVEATGLSRDNAICGDGILPATRYAVEAYAHLVSTRSLLEAVASSIT